MLTFLQLIPLFVIGLAIGSFVAALTYRYPRRISNLKGRSFCDNCKKQIGWFDNIPLLSFLVLGGRCRSCGKKISPRYPLIEISVGLGFILIGYSLINLLLFVILASIFIVDLEYQIIPDDFVFFGLAILTLFLFSTNGSFIIPSLLAGFGAATFLLCIFLFTRGRGMGLGDVKFAVLGGMISGLQFSLIWLGMAFLTGAIVGIILILTNKAKFKDKIAFGPFLVIAIPMAVIWGQKLIGLMGI